MGQGRLANLLNRTADLDQQFDDSVVEGRVLLCDADSTAYVAAATTSNIETAKRRFCSGILTAKLLAHAESVRVELTAMECTKAGRFGLKGIKRYQANREGVAKPGGVEPLRKAIGRNMFNQPAGEDWRVNLNYKFEADDQLIIDAWSIGMEACIYSADKDLRCWPGYFLDPYTWKVLPPVEGVGYLEWHETKSTSNIVGHGAIFFWCQMLVGDSADNVAGLQKCGAKKAWELLEPYHNTADESAVAELVLREYMKKKQNPWPEAYAMWLYRTPEYGFFQHIKSLNLSDELSAWMWKMFREDWYDKA